MEFHFYEKKKGKKIRDFFKPRKTIIVTCRRTVGKVLGIGGGYKTRICADRELAARGETKRIVDLLTDTAKERGYEAPLSLTNSGLEKLPEYELRISPSKMEDIISPLYIEECRRMGIDVSEKGYYKLID